MDYCDCEVGKCDGGEVERCVFRKIEGAVAKEREACAKVVEDFYTSSGMAHWFNKITAAIRARGD